MAPRKRRQNASLALLALLLVGIALPGITVQGEPETVPTTDPRNNIFVNGTTDYIILPTLDSTHTGDLTITAPDGNSMKVIVPAGQPTISAKVYFNGTVISRLTNEVCTGLSCWVALGNLNNASVNGTWIFSATGTWQAHDDNPPCASAALCRPSLNVSIQGKLLDYAIHGQSPFTVQAQQQHQTWNWHITETIWTEPEHPVITFEELAGNDPPNEAPDEDPNNARFYSQAVGAPEPALNADTLGFTVSSCSPDELTVQGFWSGGNNTQNYLTQFTYAAGDQTALMDLRMGIGAQQSPPENQGPTSPGIEPDTVIAYNNLFGTSYQFVVDNNGTEALGDIVFAPSGLCNEPPPIPPIIPPDTDQPVSGQTVSGSVECSVNSLNHNVRVTGAWQDGDNATNYTSWFWYLEGQTQDTNLSANSSATMTSTTNHGVLTPGETTRLIPYNNAGGTSFQFYINNNGTTDSGNVLFVEGAQCPTNPGGSQVPGTASCAGLVFCDYRHYEIATFLYSAQNPPDGEIFNFTWNASKLHDFNIGESVFNIMIHQTLTIIHEDAGVWEVRGELNGTPIPGCSWFIESTDPAGLLADELVTEPHVFVDCAIRNITTGQNYTFSLNRTAVTGTPGSVENTVITVQVNRHDSIDLESYQYRASEVDLSEILVAIEALNADQLAQLIEDLNNTGILSFEQLAENLTDHRNGTIEVSVSDFEGIGFDGFLYFLLFVAIMALGMWKGYMGVAITAFFAAAETWLPLDPIPVVAWVWILLLVGLIEYAARGFQALERFKATFTKE